MTFELCYRSVSKSFLLPKDLDDILHESTAFNTLHDITGCLVWHRGYFVQILEGEKSVVRQLFSKIEKDWRHEQVLLLNEGVKERRAFDQWSMAFHKFDQSNDAKILEQFENNLLLLSEFIEKPTTTIRQFWINVRRIIEKKYNSKGHSML